MGPAGTYRDVIVTKDWDPLEPEVVEEKYYAPGVGHIRTVFVRGSGGTERLVRFTPGR